jgi:hypothetical protein
MPQRRPELEYWSANSANLLERLSSRIDGLTRDEARDRLVSYGRNLPKPGQRSAFGVQF